MTAVTPSAFVDIAQLCKNDANGVRALWVDHWRLPFACSAETMPQVTLIVSADTSVGTAKNALQVRYPAIRAYHRIDSVFADGMLLAFSLILCAFHPGNSIRFFCSLVKDVTRTLIVQYSRLPTLYLFLIKIAYHIFL